MPRGNILVPIDFSAESRRAVKYASAVGKRFRAGVTWVHVVKPLTCQADYGYGAVTRQFPDQNEVKRARAKLKRLALGMTQGASPAKVLVLSGTAPFEITQAAKALGTDLIIMGCHGENSAARQIGSTAEEVVRRAPCPVFVLRRKECGTGKGRRI